MNNEGCLSKELQKTSLIYGIIIVEPQGALN